jgi:hypothetical protein
MGNVAHGSLTTVGHRSPHKGTKGDIDMEKIKATLGKQDLIYLICGRPCFGGGKYQKFTGNQWNESWEWNRAALGNLSLEDLAKEYFSDGNYEMVMSSIKGD